MAKAEITNPLPEPKKSLNTAPVYPNKAAISSFNMVATLAKSIGLIIVITKACLSIGYSWKIIK